MPQLPSGQHRIAGSNIGMGAGSMDVVALESSRELRTIVEVDLGGVWVRPDTCCPPVRTSKVCYWTDLGSAGMRSEPREVESCSFAPTAVTTYSSCD